MTTTELDEQPRSTAPPAPATVRLASVSKEDTRFVTLTD